MSRQQSGWSRRIWSYLYLYLFDALGV